MRDVRFREFFLSPSYDVKRNPYAVDAFTGMVGMLDHEKREVEIIDYLTRNKSYDLLCEYADIIWYDGKLFCIPAWPREEYSIKVLHSDGTTKEIVLKMMPLWNDSKGVMAFVRGLLVGHYLFVIGYSYPAIIRVNLDNYETDYIVGWTNTVRKLKGALDADIGFFTQGEVVLDGEFILLPYRNVSAVLMIHTTTLEERVIPIETEYIGFSGIVKLDDGRMLLAGAEKQSDWLFVWNMQNGNIEKKVRLEGDNERLPIKSMLRARSGDVYLFPWFNGQKKDLDIYRLDGRKMELENTHLIELHRNRSNSEYYAGHEINYASWVDEDTFLYVTGKDLLWHEYNVTTGYYEEYEMTCNPNDMSYMHALREYFQDNASKGVPIKEGEIDIDDFIRVMFREKQK